MPLVHAGNICEFTQAIYILTNRRLLPNGLMAMRHALDTVLETSFAAILDGNGSVLLDSPPRIPRQMDVSSSSRADAVDSVRAAESIGHESSADRHAEHTEQSQPFQVGSASGIVEEDEGQNKPSRKSSFVAEEVTEVAGSHGRECSRRYFTHSSATCSSVADLLSE